jgi:glycosyltransferase involved in cell wall biosynthesis
MDMIITTSNFSKEVLLSTVYNENDKNTNRLIKQHRIDKPINVLFEGVDKKIYNNNVNDTFKLDIEEDFAYLFVGHWLKGSIGQDRKDVGMLIKCFANSFKDEIDKPALILKTSSASFSVKERENLINRIQKIVGDDKVPVYLLFGDLKDEEMNDLYNHPKVKAMVSITKGEGFGRPLLEFTMTGKPVIASNWSGHKDFLPMDYAAMIGGKLTDVDVSAQDNFIIKDSKWFTANYDEFIHVLKLVKSNYDEFLIKSEKLRIMNSEKFTLDKMKELLKSYMEPHSIISKQINLMLPKLNKIK